MSRKVQRNQEIRAEALRQRLQGKTYQQIASQLGVSQQRVQQLIQPPIATERHLRQRAGGKCEACGATLQPGRAHRHHRRSDCDADAYNSIDNLELLCPGCHTSSPDHARMRERVVRRHSPPAIAIRLEAYVLHGVMTREEAEVYARQIKAARHVGTRDRAPDRKITAK